MQLDNYKVILNISEIDLGQFHPLKLIGIESTELIGRTNFITKGRKGAKKVGSTEMWFGKKMDCGHYSGKGALDVEKSERQTRTQGSTWGKRIPIAIGLEKVLKGARFHESLQPAGLKALTFQGRWALLGIVCRPWGSSWRESRAHSL